LNDGRRGIKGEPSQGSPLVIRTRGGIQTIIMSENHTYRGFYSYDEIKKGTILFFRAVIFSQAVLKN
jgi:hypothetical protein